MASLRLKPLPAIYLFYLLVVADGLRCHGRGVGARTPSEEVLPHMFLKEDARIQSPNFPHNYPFNLNVVWNVSTVPGHRIKVVFIVKEMESSRGCKYDRLSLYDGSDRSSLLGVYCHHDPEELPEPVVSSFNAMVVSFISDNSITLKGFDLALSTVCGGTLFAEPTENEFVSHPKFGDDAYGQNNSCVWIIKSSPGKNVQIRFSDFDVGIAFQSANAEKPLEEIEVEHCETLTTGNCVQYNANDENSWKDFVEMYDGPDDSSKIGKYAGDQTPPPITSRGEELLVRFRSGDAAGYFRGFRAVYQEV